MSIFDIKKGGGNSERPEDGSYMARIVGIVDLDHQPEFAFGPGPDDKIAAGYKIQFVYELIGQLNSEGRPFHVSEEVNNIDSDRSNLRKRINAFQVDALDEALEKAVMIQVGSTSKGNAKIAAVAPMMAGVEVGPLENTPYMFSFAAPNLGMFEIMPKYIQRKVTKSTNFEGSDLHRMLVETDHDILKEPTEDKPPF